MGLATQNVSEVYTLRQNVVIERAAGRVLDYLRDPVASCLGRGKVRRLDQVPVDGLTPPEVRLYEVQKACGMQDLRQDVE